MEKAAVIYQDARFRVHEILDSTGETDYCVEVAHGQDRSGQTRWIEGDADDVRIGLKQALWSARSKLSRRKIKLVPLDMLAMVNTVIGPKDPPLTFQLPPNHDKVFVQVMTQHLNIPNWFMTTDVNQWHPLEGEGLWTTLDHRTGIRSVLISRHLLSDAAWELMQHIPFSLNVGISRKPTTQHCSGCESCEGTGEHK